MTRPYPWRERRDFEQQQRRARTVRRAAVAATLIAALLSLISLPVLAWSWIGYRRTNDSWRTRPMIIFGLGLVIMIISFRPAAWLRRWSTVWTPAPETVGSPILVHVLLGAAGPALIITALSAAGFGYAYEWTARRYLEPTGRTVRQRHRSRRHVRFLRQGGLTAGMINFGVLSDDLLAWRTPRRGALAGIAADQLGSGLIVGDDPADTGLTAATLAQQSLAAGASVAYLDGSGSNETLARLAALAGATGVPFTSFDVGVGTLRSTWYDPLGWPGSPEEKAAGLVSALEYARGGAVGYDHRVRDWVALQFAAMEEFGLLPEESRFDFLLDTCDPARMTERIDHFRQAIDDRQVDHADWIRRVQAFDQQLPSRLVEDLTTLINAAGPRLRPANPGDLPVSFAALGSTAGLVHVGLAAGTDTAFVRNALFALVMADLAAYAGSRSSSDHDHHRLMVLADRTELVGARVDTVEPVIAAGRDRGVALWPITASLSDWSASTRELLRRDDITLIMHRTTDPGTAGQLGSAVGPVPALADPADPQSAVTSTALLTADDLGRLADRHALIRFPAGTRPTDWRSSRVPEDEIAVEVPEVHVVPPAVLIDPPPVQEAAPSFTDLVAPAAELTQLRTADRTLTPDQARRLRMAAYRSRQQQQVPTREPADHGEPDWVPDEAVSIGPAAQLSWGEWTPVDDDRSDSAPGQGTGRGAAPVPRPALDPTGTPVFRPDPRSAASDDLPGRQHVRRTGNAPTGRKSADAGGSGRAT